MKKTLSKLIAAILCVALSASIFAACDWITVNTERDLAQKVATVRIADGVDAQDILKKDLKARYMSYEYQYVYYYGNTESQAYERALNSLVQNRVIIQKARLDLAASYNASLSAGADLDEFAAYFKKNALAGGKAINAANGEITVNSDKAEGLVQYLTAYEYKQAYNAVRSSINSMIESNMDDEDEDETESATYTDRTAPTAEDHADLTESELKETVPTHAERVTASATLGNAAFSAEIADLYTLNTKVYDEYKIDIVSSAERRKAFNTVIKNLKNNGLIGEDETVTKEEYEADPDAVLNYSYFKNLVKSQMESIIVDKYQKSLVSSTQAKLNSDAIWDQFLLDYKAQEAKYKNNYSAYETALDAASDTSLVLYNPYENYGYVANILIGFTSEQSALLSAKKAEKNVTAAEIKAKRAELAADIDAADQRSSWVLSNHGEYSEGEFLFEDAYLVEGASDELNETLSRFVGSVSVKDENGYTVKTDDGALVTKWLFEDVSATKIPFADFVADYLGKIGLSGLIFDKNDSSTVAYMNGYDGSGKELEKIDLDSVKQLTFAFSTDPGILSKTYGYLYSPYTSATTYVSEFADAAKALVEKGVGAYTTVLTDFGYHVMVCTKVVKDEYDVETDKDAFVADLDVKGTLAYNYKQVKYDSLTDNEISKFVNKFINETISSESSAVTYYADNYSDLINSSSAN